MKETKSYGLFVAISMVVGIVIGSGIFFKSDDVLQATGGSVVLGLLGFLIVGIGVLFGTLVISEYSIKNPSEGGLIAYSKDAFNDGIGYYVSWFLVAVYFPALIVILGYVCIIYLSELLNIESTTFMYVGTFSVLFLAFASNLISKRLGGYIQSVSTVIKLIPLFIIGIVGILFFQTPDAVPVSNEIIQNKNFFSALIAIAFAFDGWIVVTSISSELKDPKKTLPKALCFGVLAIITIYCLYFLGVTHLLSPGEIINLGDAHTATAAELVFGPLGGKIITLFIVISVYGGLNGMVLAYLRLPHALVSKGMMKNVFNIKEIDPETGFPIGSIIFTALLTLFYFVLQMLISSNILFGNLAIPFDLSSLPVTFNYLIYTALYIQVFHVSGKRDTKLILFVFVAVITSLLVIYGALQINGLIYILISLLFIVGGAPFRNKKHTTLETALLIASFVGLCILLIIVLPFNIFTF